MNRNAALVHAFLFIKKNRLRKKSNFHKMALRLMVDFTTAIYLLLIGGYVIASLFIMGDIIETYYHYFVFAEEQAVKRYWLLLTILPVRYVIRSFRDPGIIFSSSEYQLGVLPFSKEKVWILCVVEKWMKQILRVAGVGAIVVAVTPLSASVVGAYILLFIVMDIILTIPQWKLYQCQMVIKMCWLCGIIILNLIALLSSHLIIGLVLIVLILVINLTISGSIFRSVHWGKVMEISDFKIWNMPLIGKASGTKFKRQRKFSTFRNSAEQKKPFSYTTKSIHRRLWRVYLGNQVEPILQLLGTLFLMLMVLLFISDLAFHIAIAVAIYIYATVASSFFSDRFQTDILEVLPWDLQSYKWSFFKWMVYGSVPLLVPIILYFVLHGTIWSPVQFVFYVSTFILVYQIKIDKAHAFLTKQTGYFNNNSVLALLMIVLVALNGLYPFLSLSFIVVVCMMCFDHRKLKGGKPYG